MIAMHTAGNGPVHIKFHAHTCEDEGLPSVLSAISQSTPQLGPSLLPLPPHTHYPSGTNGGYMEGNRLRCSTRRGPSRAGPLNEIGPLCMAAGPTAVAHPNPAAVTGYHVAGLDTQIGHLCRELTDPQSLINYPRLLPKVLMFLKG